MHGARYSQVRKLAREYADHGLSRDEYLARRRTLIGAIASGKITLRYANATGIAEESPTRSVRRPLMLAILALALLAGVATGLLFLDRPRPAAPPSPTTSPAAETGPGVALVENFVQAGNWSAQSIVRFETQMLQLTPRQRARLRESIWFRRLSAELARQITEQEAMIPLDKSGKAKRRAESLKAFAARLQIDPDA